MSITIRKTVNFGQTGLTPTCAVTPSTDVTFGTITELGTSGCYYVDITVPSLANYAVLWSDGQTPATYASDEIIPLGALSSQDIADALKVAPSAGDPAAGSAMASLASVSDDIFALSQTATGIAETQTDQGGTLSDLYEVAEAVNPMIVDGVFTVDAMLNARGLSDSQAAQLSAIQTQTLLISSGKLNIVNPYLIGKVLVIVKDDDYPAARDRTIAIVPDTWIDPTDATIVLHIIDLESQEEVTTIDGTASTEDEEYTFNPMNAETSLLDRTGIGRYQWAVKYHYADETSFTAMLGPTIVK